MFQVKGKSQPS